MVFTFSYKVWNTNSEWKKPPLLPVHCGLVECVFLPPSILSCLTSQIHIVIFKRSACFIARLVVKPILKNMCNYVFSKFNIYTENVLVESSAVTTLRYQAERYQALLVYGSLYCTTLVIFRTNWWQPVWHIELSYIIWKGIGSKCFGHHLWKIIIEYLSIYVCASLKWRIVSVS